MSVAAEPATRAKRRRGADDADDAPPAKRTTAPAAGETTEPSYDAWHGVPARPVECGLMLNRAISVVRAAGAPPPVVRYCARKEAVEMRWNARFRISLHYVFDWFNNVDEFTVISHVGEDPLASMEEECFSCLDAIFDDAVLEAIRPVLPARE